MILIIGNSKTCKHPHIVSLASGTAVEHYMYKASLKFHAGLWQVLKKLKTKAKRGARKMSFAVTGKTSHCVKGKTLGADKVHSSPNGQESKV